MRQKKNCFVYRLYGTQNDRLELTVSMQNMRTGGDEPLVWYGFMACTNIGLFAQTKQTKTGGGDDMHKLIIYFGPDRRTHTEKCSPLNSKTGVRTLVTTPQLVIIFTKKTL